MNISSGVVKVHCANNGAWIGAMDLVQACLPYFALMGVFLHNNSKINKDFPCMNLHEYQAKQLFGAHGIPVPAGKPVTSVAEALAAADALGGDTWGVKAQGHAGGGGRGGGGGKEKKRRG